MIGKYVSVAALVFSSSAFSYNFVETGTSPYCVENEPIYWHYKKLYQQGTTSEGTEFEEGVVPDNKGFSYYQPSFTQGLAEVHYTNDVTLRNDVIDPWQLTGYVRPKDALTLASHAAQKYKSATQMYMGCKAGQVTFASVLNIADVPKQSINYGNPEMSHIYRYHNKYGWPSPFEDGEGAIDFKVESHLPYYRGFNGHMGGHVTLSLFMSTNENPVTFINYTTILYSMNPRQRVDVERIPGTDPNNNAWHIVSHVGKNTRYTTQMEFSEGSMRARNRVYAKKNDPVFNHFFNFQVTYENVQTLLTDLCKEHDQFCTGKYSTPDAWVFRQSSMHYELNDNKGTAVMAGAHRGFRITFK